jgi:hypothetical protein
MDNETTLVAVTTAEPRRADGDPITVDNSLRSITLKGPGAWLLYGSAQQVYYCTRATDASGNVVQGERPAPTTALGPGTAGTPAAGKAWDPSNGSVSGALALPTDTSDWRKIAVPASGYRTLYVSAPGGLATPRLEGPYE